MDLNYVPFLALLVIKNPEQKLRVLPAKGLWPAFVILRLFEDSFKIGDENPQIRKRILYHRLIELIRRILDHSNLKIPYISGLTKRATH